MSVHQAHAGAKACSLPPSGQDRFPLPLPPVKSVDFGLTFLGKEDLEGGLHPLGPRLRAPLGPADGPEGLGALLEAKVHRADTVF